MRSKLSNKTVILFLSILLAQLVALTAFAATAPAGLQLGGDGVWNSENATYTVSATGGCKQSGTAEMTLKNNSGSEAVFVFTYVENVGQDDNPTYSIQSDVAGTLAVSSGQAYSHNMKAGEIITFSVTTAKGKYTSSIALSSVSLTPAQSVSISLQVAENGSFTVAHNGKTETVTENKTVSVLNSEGATLVATPAANYKFIGWRDVSTGKLLSTSATYVEKTARTVKPEFISASAVAAFQVKNGSAYYYLNDALDAVGNSGTIIVVDNATVFAGNYTIPAGATLLIPYNDTHTLITDNMEDHWSEATTVGSEYMRLSMNSGANITVYGAISVGSQACRQMVGQVGDYGAIVMEKGSHITIKSGANLYAYGYIFHGSTGSGTVSVENGGTVYESGFIMDYPGSVSNTNDTYNAKVFPMRSYTVRNVEVPMTFAAGAKETLFYSLYGSSIGGEYPGYFNFIGDTSEYPFQLKNDATLTKSYSDGIQYLMLNGDFTMNTLKISMKFSFLGKAVDVKSSDTDGFPLPGGYVVNIASGQLTLNDNLIMVEGSKVIIGENASVLTNGKNVYVIDAEDDYGTTDITDVHGTHYTLVDKDAVLEVNGILTVSEGSGLYTSASKASIISNGNGVITFEGAAPTDTLGLKIRIGKGYINEAESKGNILYTAGYTGRTSEFPAISMSAAYLQNANGDHVATSGATASTTYYYFQGKWTSTKPTLQDFLTRIVLGDSLDMQFAFKATLLSKAEGNYVTVSKTFADAATNPDRANYKGFDYTPDQWETISVYGTQYYVVTFPDISGKEMCDTITLTFNGQDITNGGHTDTVRDYVLRILNTGSYGDANNKMLVDLLYYGAAAQTYYGYGTGDLANAGLESYTHTTTVPTIENNSTFEVNSDYVHPKDITIAKATTFSRLELTNGFYLHATFNGLHKNMTAVATFDGSTYPLRFGTDGKSVYFTTQEVLPMSMADARTEVVIKVYDGETLVCTIADSVASYVARVINGTQKETGLVDAEDFANLKALLQRIVMFSDSVKQYVEPWYGNKEG